MSEMQFAAERESSRELMLPTDGSMLADWESAIAERLIPPKSIEMLQSWHALKPLTNALRPFGFDLVSLRFMHVEPMEHPLQELLAAIDQDDVFMGSESPEQPNNLRELAPSLIEGYTIYATAVSSSGWNETGGIIGDIDTRVWYVVKEGDAVATYVPSGLDLLRYVGILRYDPEAFENFRK